MPVSPAPCYPSVLICDPLPPWPLDSDMSHATWLLLMFTPAFGLCSHSLCSAYISPDMGMAPFLTVFKSLHDYHLAHEALFDLPTPDLHCTETCTSQVFIFPHRTEHSPTCHVLPSLPTRLQTPGGQGFLSIFLTAVSPAPGTMPSTEQGLRRRVVNE